MGFRVVCLQFTPPPHSRRGFDRTELRGGVGGEEEEEDLSPAAR